MKKFATILIALTFVMGTIASAQAQDADCAYDVVGITAGGGGTPWSFSPDGWVTFNRANWWEDDIYACYYTHVYPQYYTYFSACDFNNDGQVIMDEVYEMYYFIINHPWPHSGASHAYKCPEITPDPCMDLAGLNFGDPSGMPLGAGVIDGSCQMIFGTTIPEGVELFSNTNECSAACSGCSTNDDCAADEYCFHEDYTCGSAGLGTCTDLGEICSMIYDPVCTCDHQIASNACMAAVYGKSILSDGECSQEDICNYNGGTWNGNSCDCPAGTQHNYQRGCEAV